MVLDVMKMSPLQALRIGKTIRSQKYISDLACYIILIQ